jgi:hypothetical protein
MTHNCHAHSQLSIQSLPKDRSSLVENALAKSPSQSYQIVWFSKASLSP